MGYLVIIGIIFIRQFSYEDKTRFDYWKRMEFSEKHWTELKNHCEEKLKNAEIKIKKVVDNKIQNIDE